MFFVPLLLTAPVLTKAAFHPNQYASFASHATCNAILRTPEPATEVKINIDYIDINPNSKSTILMVHGWPSLWSSWARQIDEFKDDYRLIVPNLRGFGGSTHPGDVRNSGTMGDIVSDLVCVLLHAGVRARSENLICMGHDWGSQICYEAARYRPDIFTHVIGAVVPYIPSAGPFLPVKNLVPLLPKLAYQVYFNNKTEEAEEELNKDKRRALRATLRTVDSPPPDAFLKSQDNFLGAYDGVEIPPIPFFSEEEEDYFVGQYEIQGFGNTLQFYMNENRYQTWELDNAQKNFTIPQPVLAIYPTEDPVADWSTAAHLLNSSAYLPKMTTQLMKGAHWVHLEYPEEFNKLVRAWLEDNVHSAGIKDMSEQINHEEL